MLLGNWLPPGLASGNMNFKEVAILVDDFTRPTPAYAGVSMAKAGGTLILVAPCTEGSGSKAGRESFRELAAMAPDELMTLIRRGEVSASGGAFDYCYSKAMNRNRVVLVSDNYSEPEARDLGVGHANSVQVAVNNALADVGADGQVGVLPVGGLTVPLPGESASQ